MVIQLILNFINKKSTTQHLISHIFLFKTYENRTSFIIYNNLLNNEAMFTCFTFGNFRHNITMMICVYNIFVYRNTLPM